MCRSGKRDQAQDYRCAVLVVEPKFVVGDRVTRPYNVYDEESRLMHGTVVRVYSRNDRFGRYPELYAVQWDEADVKESGEGYLPHGLDRVVPAGRA